MTTIEIEDHVEIRRPLVDVFEFLSDHAHRPAWTAGVKRARRTSAGPVGVGATYQVVGRALGRRVESTYELTELDPCRTFSGCLTSKLFTVEETYRLEGDGHSTAVRLTARATAHGRLRLLGPMLAMVVERQIRADHRRLKSILERRPPPPGGAGGEGSDVAPAASGQAEAGPTEE